MNRHVIQSAGNSFQSVFSRLWALVLAFVFIYGLAVLVTVSSQAYSDKPPLPALINADGSGFQD